GYDAEWQVISAADVGAPHLRRRLWIVAYPGCVSGRSGMVFGDCRTSAGRYQDSQVGGEYREFAGLGAEATGGLSAWGAPQPGLDRMAHGVPSRAHRLRGLGNAVVPQ